jgi:hypothetical protein
METNLKYKIYSIIKMTDKNRLLKEFDYETYDTFDEAMEILKHSGDEFINYTIIPIIRCF